MRHRPLKPLGILAGIVLGLAVLVIGGGTVWFRHWRTVHRHCIKCAGLAFHEYARDHNGVLPYSTNGFGDALLLLVKGGYLPNVMCLCGPGDNGNVLSNALAHGLPVPEAQCSRVYIQGLNAANNAAICILFDRRSAPGGDHFYGHGKPLREVCLLDGSMQTVLDEQWPKFCREQIDLLVAAGINREQAWRYYQPTGRPEHD